MGRVARRGIQADEDRMSFIRRLMEIKEEQREWEDRQERYIFCIDRTLTLILKELKRRKDGKSKN